MYFDVRNHSSSSDRFDGADRLATSVVSVDERLAFGDEFRRKDEGANSKIPSVPSDHCLGDFGNLNEEGVFRPVFLAQFQLLRRGTFLSGVPNISPRFYPDLTHHAGPDRWCSPDAGPLSNSSQEALRHSRSPTLASCSSP